jgi:hypothetical protein
VNFCIALNKIGLLHGGHTFSMIGRVEDKIHHALHFKSLL